MGEACPARGTAQLKVVFVDVLQFPDAVHSEATTHITPYSTPYPWYALKVRMRSELLAGEGLLARGYEPFVPTCKEKKTYSDRLKVVETAAFPGYIFCRFDTQVKAPILSSPAVQYVVSFAGRPAIISDDTIEVVRRAIAAGAQPAPYVSVGQQIRITSGVLAGLEGLLLRIGKQERIVLSVHLLQRSVAVEIDRDCFRPL